VLCTEKDAVKLFARYPEAGQQLLAVPLVFTPEPGFMQAFDARLSALLPPISH
jgi:tetraacyldisaccharide 4'-kinase